MSWQDHKECTNVKSFLLATEESGLLQPQHWHGCHTSVPPTASGNCKSNHGEIMILSESTYIHDPIFKSCWTSLKIHLNKSRYFLKYVQTSSLPHVADADKHPSNLTWAICEKPAFPLKQERALYLTAVSRWLFSCPSAMHFVNIKHLSPEMPHLPAPLKSRKSAFLLASRLYLKRPVMDCYLTSSQTNNSSQSKMTHEHESLKCVAGPLVSLGSELSPSWKELRYQRKQIFHHSYCFDSNAETSQAEWINIPHYSCILSKVPHSKDWTLFVSQGQVPGGN